MEEVPLHRLHHHHEVLKWDDDFDEARESLGLLRAGMEQHLAALERQLEEAEARSAEDHHFAADMHAWNLSLLAQQKADQQRIQELEATSKVSSSSSSIIFDIIILTFIILIFRSVRR